MEVIWMFELSNENVIYSFSKENKPVALVKSGDRMVIGTKDCFTNQIRKREDKLEAIDWECINPATGPVYVEGAMPGDVLKVTIEKIKNELANIIFINLI
jgi:amidase